MLAHERRTTTSALKLGEAMTRGWAVRTIEMPTLMKMMYLMMEGATEVSQLSV